MDKLFTSQNYLWFKKDSSGLSLLYIVIVYYSKGLFGLFDVSIKQSIVVLRNIFW